MRLQICNRQEAEALPGRSDWAVISIADPISSFGPARLLPDWHAVLRVEFFDTDPVEDIPDIVMTNRDARQIIEFVRLHVQEVEGFVIHCNQGVSRSQAVAAWIANAYNLEFTTDDSFNRHVFNLLKAEAAI